MKTFHKMCAQGDVFFTKVDYLPEGTKEEPSKNGRVVVAHSETQHDHVMDARTTTLYRLPEEIYECFLVVKEPTALEHLRSFDTHEPIMFEPGIYRVRRQREYTPEGWRRAAD